MHLTRRDRILPGEWSIAKPEDTAPHNGSPIYSTSFFVGWLQMTATGDHSPLAFPTTACLPVTDPTTPRLSILLIWVPTESIRRSMVGEFRTESLSELEPLDTCADPLEG